MYSHDANCLTNGLKLNFEYITIILKVSTFLFVHDMFFFFHGNQSHIFSYLLYGSDRLFSCNGRALLAWCPRHILFVFIINLIVDILMDIYVMVKNYGYPLTSVT